jgi:hypothetical protein
MIFATLPLFTLCAKKMNPIENDSPTTSRPLPNTTEPSFVLSSNYIKSVVNDSSEEIEELIKDNTKPKVKKSLTFIIMSRQRILTEEEQAYVNSIWQVVENEKKEAENDQFEQDPKLDTGLEQEIEFKSDSVSFEITYEKDLKMKNPPSEISEHEDLPYFDEGEPLALNSPISSSNDVSTSTTSIEKQPFEPEKEVVETETNFSLYPFTPYSPKTADSSTEEDLFEKILN